MSIMNSRNWEWFCRYSRKQDRMNVKYPEHYSQNGCNVDCCPCLCHSNPFISYMKCGPRICVSISGKNISINYTNHIILRREKAIVIICMWSEWKNQSNVINSRSINEWFLRILTRPSSLRFEYWDNQSFHGWVGLFSFSHSHGRPSNIRKSFILE